MAFNEDVAHRLSVFYNSDLWELIKARLEVYTERLENNALNSIRQNKNGEALKHTSVADGVRSAIEVAERLTGDLQKGVLDADEILGVIENKPKEKKWKKILGKLKKKK